MNCPYCGTRIPDNINYCTACGGDVQAGLARLRELEASQYQSGSGYSTGYGSYYGTEGQPQPAAPVNAAQPQAAQTRTMQMPQAAQPQAGQALTMQMSQPAGNPRSDAVNPVYQAAKNNGYAYNGQGKKRGGAPVWPYIVIVILLLVIIAALLLLWHPWSSGSQTQQVNTPQTTQAEGSDPGVLDPAEDQSQGQATVVTTVGEGAGDGAVTPDAATPDATTDASATGASDEAIYTQLTQVYGLLAGYDAAIGSVAEQFNSYYTSSDLATRQQYAAGALQVYTELQALLASTDAMQVPTTSPYYTQWSNIRTLVDCLVNRVRVLSDAWQLSAGTSDVSSVSSQISAILSADNETPDANGYTNKYKKLYASLYPSAAPVHA